MKIVNVNDLIKYCEEENFRIICYGAGTRAQEIADSYITQGLLKEIYVFVDRNENLQKAGIEVGGKRFKVISIQQMNTLYQEGKYVILITNVMFQDIMDELIEKNKFDSNLVFSLEYLTFMEIEKNELERKIPHNLKKNSYMLIPKIIHYCWFGKNPIPDKYKEWMKSWKKKCPDYEIIEWNECNYDVYKNEYMAQAYEKKKWGFVPDYARLDIIYNNGGIYLDTDVELLDNFDDLLYQKAFAGFETRKYVALGLGFGAEKNNDIIKKMLDYYDTISFINEDGSLNMTPSPKYQTEVLKGIGLKQDGEYQDVCGMTIYPSKMFNGINIATGEISKSEYTKSIHHYDASWQTADYIREREIRRKMLILSRK